MDSRPLIETALWEKAFSKSEALKDAIINPNSDFMTKLLFDARFFAKRSGKEISYYSNAIFALKMALAENGALGAKQLADKAKLGEKEALELLAYLANMSEVGEEEGKYSLNYANNYSKVFGCGK
ncbi:MAG TPA: hypothetical protein HA254_03445 [Candidatus Diapherotrites archaeon]|uniref:Uncharacterized protein n=1 Tax=Candidatus Iainarchaeum sp. TaxID=3101447 RepID=A0A7J4IVZ6_9ARCH|nr:hypothetical protein [Candidatus Diapherotrites archaeon]